MWASQDRDPVERAARNFCFGLKKVFKEEWNIPYNVKISEEKPYTMTVGGELALTAHVSHNEVVHEWHGAWANWDELHLSAEVKVSLEKSQALITRTRNERVIEKWAERPSLGTTPFESAVSFTHVAPFRCISWFSIG